MISWIRGEVIDAWIQTKKFYVLINCQGLGYEVQVLQNFKKGLEEKTVILWIHEIKREDSDYLFGFRDKAKRDFFRDLLQVKGIGPQIGMSILDKYNLNQVFNSVKNKDKALFNSIPGIGEKMTERIFLELKNKITVTTKNIEDFTETSNNAELKEEIKILIDDLDLALKSLSYTLKERKKVLNLIITKINQPNISTQKVENNFTFEILLKESLDLLEKE